MYIYTCICEYIKDLHIKEVYKLPQLYTGYLKCIKHSLVADLLRVQKNCSTKLLSEIMPKIFKMILKQHCRKFLQQKLLLFRL